VKVKKFLENLAGDFINLHDTLRAIAIAEEVTYQEAALFLHQLINDLAGLQPIPSWKRDPISLPVIEINEASVKLCLRCLHQAATYGEPPACDKDGLYESYLFSDLYPGIEPLGAYKNIGFNKPEMNAFLLTQGVDISTVVLKDDTPIRSKSFAYEPKGIKANESLVKIISECQQEKSRLQLENQELQELKYKLHTLEGTVNELNSELEKKNSELVSIGIKYTANQKDIADGKSRSTLLKVIAGLALCGRKIDVRTERLKGLSDLVRDFETFGVKVDQKTLSAYLKESSEYID
jgi:hypothetical protein